MPPSASDRSVLRRLLLCLVALLAAPPLYAQLDTTTMGGRIVTRRAAAVRQNPAVRDLLSQGPLQLDASRVELLDDTTLVELLRLMTHAFRRDERICHSIAVLDDRAIVVMMINGVTDSLEAEAWADVTERIAWALVTGQDEFAVGSIEELMVAMTPLFEKMDVKILVRLKRSGDTRSECKLTRSLLTNLAHADPATAGPLYRVMLVLGLNPKMQTRR